MISTRNSGFFVKCPFCAEEHHNCRESFKNQNVVFTKCHQIFTLIEYQNNTQKSSTEISMEMREQVEILLVRLEET
jgi:hypothetical protein